LIETAFVADIGDVTSDDHADLVIARPYSDEVDVYEGRGDGTFEVGANAAVGIRPEGIVIDDFDADGVSDVITLNRGQESDVPSNVSILLSRGDGGLEPEVRFPTDPRPEGLGVGDLNRDGVPDVVTASGVGGRLSILYSNP
jgi:hypothetical protein